MATTLEELEKQARALTPDEKAALAHLLIEQLEEQYGVRLSFREAKSRAILIVAVAHHRRRPDY
jgi:hypothetical protein